MIGRIPTAAAPTSSSLAPSQDIDARLWVDPEAPARQLVDDDRADDGRGHSYLSADGRYVVIGEHRQLLLPVPYRW